MQSNYQTPGVYKRESVLPSTAELQTGIAGFVGLMSTGEFAKQLSAPRSLSRMNEFDALFEDHLVAGSYLSQAVNGVNPVADATSNTFGYVADVIGGSGLMPGFAVNVHLPRTSAAISFWIPRAVFPAAADLRDNTSVTLFIADGTRAYARLVKVNLIEGDQVEIVSGLSVNDNVILSPPAELKDQDLIEISAT